MGNLTTNQKFIALAGLVFVCGAGVYMVHKNLEEAKRLGLIGKKIVSNHLQYYSKLVFDTARQSGVPADVANIMAAQARHESNDFKSNVFVNNNNTFGMKMPSIRKSPFIFGSGSSAPPSEGATPYAKYASVEDSVRDLIHWFSYNKVDWTAIGTPNAYNDFVNSKGYYGKDQYDVYRNSLNRLVTNFKEVYVATLQKTKQHPKTTILIGLAGLGLMATGAYYLFKK